MNICYVDDEKDLCELFQDLIEDEGVTVATWSDPSVAYSEVVDQNPDIIFLDHRMPGMNGIEFAQKIKESELAHIPCVLITGELSVETDVDFLKIVSKPFEPDEIFEIIDSVKSQKAA